MEVSQGNSLCSYFKQTKMSFFSSSFFLIQKSENRRAVPRRVSTREGRGGEMVKEGEYGANAVYTCM
jgi:hypothetical protein